MPPKDLRDRNRLIVLNALIEQDYRISDKAYSSSSSKDSWCTSLLERTPEMDQLKAWKESAFSKESSDNSVDNDLFFLSFDPSAI